MKDRENNFSYDDHPYRDMTLAEIDEFEHLRRFGCLPHLQPARSNVATHDYSEDVSAIPEARIRQDGKVRKKYT